MRTACFTVRRPPSAVHATVGWSQKRAQRALTIRYPRSAIRFFF